mmetsp:Transcript_69249/g.214142  ORF Transcript_69249/g.214142 Transcript_69249/m.214142 type:complete len:250 (+) Transcript_69249:633-1382(+)
MHLIDHEALQAGARIEVEVFLEALADLTVVHIVAELVCLIATEVEVVAGEQACDLFNGAQDVLHGLLGGDDDAVGAAHAVRRSLQGFVLLVFCATLVQLHHAEVYVLAAGGDDEGRGVRWDVDLGDDLDCQRRSERHQLLHLLAAEEARGAVRRSVVLLLPVLIALWPVEGTTSQAADQAQLWPASHLHAPALVVGEVEVQLVELVHGHQEQQLLHLVQTKEVPRDIQHQTSPSVARPVADPAERHAQG